MDPHALFGGLPYQGYAYAYPHKTAYRAFATERSLEEIWRDQPDQTLFLYTHVPFCFQRCAFCNLFTAVHGARERQERYLAALVRQAEVTRSVLPDATFALGAIGGGTPTWLDPDALERVFDVLEHTMGAALGSIPLSVECSPETVTPEKADILVRRGATRASMGIQSFIDIEARGVGRTQRGVTVQTALEALRDAKIPTINLDLIYGLRHQTAESWRTSLECTLEWRPEEIFLYPLYVRPLTALGRRDRSWDDERLARYREGRDLLRLAGYEQVSMRMFRAPHAPREHTRYRCQSDGMVGLGAGARSYTRDVHWSTRFAVAPSAVLTELDAWLDRSDREHSHAQWGFELDTDERKRRHVLQGLLQVSGLDRAEYAEVFGADPLEHFAELRSLVEAGLAEAGEGVVLTEEGLAWSDAIAPWLYSDAVKAGMAGWDER